MSSKPPNLNENQRRTLLAAFIYIDQRLSKGLAGLASDNQGAIFPAIVPDIAPHQQAMLTGLISRLRAALREAVGHCGLEVPRPTLGAKRHLRTQLIMADIVLADLSSRHLRGYGPVDETTSASIKAVQDRLRGVFRDSLMLLDSMPHDEAVAPNISTNIHISTDGG
jgi:hypothetical protein